MGTLSRAALLSGLSIAAVVGAPTAADAYHGYSTAHENSAGSYTGVTEGRPASTITSQEADGCSGYFAGHPIYSTEWIGFSWGFLELGTGHQCNNTKTYDYWGQGYQGTWIPFGETAWNGATHSYSMAYASGAWQWKRDGSSLGSISGLASTFGDTSLGLESYSSPAHISYTAFGNLQKNVGSGWANWSGQDSGPTVDTGMCGAYYPNDYTYIGGEHVC